MYVCVFSAVLLTRICIFYLMFLVFGTRVCVNVWLQL